MVRHAVYTRLHGVAFLAAVNFSSYRAHIKSEKSKEWFSYTDVKVAMSIVPYGVGRLVGWLVGWLVVWLVGLLVSIRRLKHSFHSKDNTHLTRAM
jgi:hypothetical protein